MYREAIRRKVIGLRASGLSVSAVARSSGVSRACVREWSADPERALTQARRSTCFVCGGAPCPEPTTYAYLLGQYLGDGYLVTSSRVPRLRVACADAYPRIAEQVDRAMTCMSGNVAGHVQSVGCSDHYCDWMHWPCLFPQHGPGRKHERPIVLAEWQRDLVAAHPWSLIRGLIHSDGCRSINRVTVRGRTYEYPRYLLANESRDILAIAGDALELVGVKWRYNRPNSISVARRDSVASMERNVGPKT